MNFLARREHSRVELVRKLSERDYEQPDIAQALDRLANEGLQSDERFCEQFVRLRSQQGYGPRRIRQELRTRGVAVAMIEQGLSQQINWQRVLRDAWEKRYGAYPSTPAESVKQYRFLLNRGFDPDKVQAHLKRVSNACEYPILDDDQ